MLQFSLRTLFTLFVGLLGLTSTWAFQNPIKAKDGSDPFMVWHEGYYYLTTTTWSNIQIARATTIAGLKTASPKVVWQDTNTASRCCNLWAPEIHWQSKEGSWYIYYSAGTAGTFDNQRMHVLKGSSTNIWSSSWSYAGRIVIPNRDIWGIDGSIMVIGETRYWIYSSWDGADQCLWIAKMNSATTVGNAVKISTPTYAWERVTANVNEGAAILYGGGRTLLIYSASNCAGTGYKLGMLELRAGADPLNPGSWTKSSQPVFQSANGIYQPGHNGFFLSPSGNQTWMVYHANSVTPGTCDGNRYTAIQRVNWSGSSPVFGAPISLSSNIAEPV
ncbi:glycoside hydrolase family 43 protein [Coprinopsis sp. MPI-PUGE-AT-0042]|nr:glycoside hydrolase family 43 protein [Coprinopsis sp. MPI-PUGE-AT-0042]